MSKTKKFIFFVVVPVLLLNIILIIVFVGQKSEAETARLQNKDSAAADVLPIPVNEKSNEEKEKITDIYKEKVLEEKSAPKREKNVSLSELFGDDEVTADTESTNEFNGDDEFSPNLNRNVKSSSSQSATYQNKNSGSSYRKSSGHNYGGGSYHKKTTVSHNSYSGYHKKSGFDIPGLEDEENKEKEAAAANENNNTKKVRTRSGFTRVVSDNTNNYDNSVITAVVQNENREVRSGSTVRLRLKQPVTVNGVTIPANTLLSGIASLTNERVIIHITRILYGGRIYTCNYSVYDLDGIEGIYIPGGLNQELAKQEVGQRVGQTTVTVPFVGSISTSFGRKKIQDPAVKIPNGYKVLLK